jgi:hypothetical protein
MVFAEPKSLNRSVILEKGAKTQYMVSINYMIHNI